MIPEQELLAVVGRLKAEALRRWIALGWISPAQSVHGPIFEEADVARVRLICDLVYDIQMDEESLPVVLSLLDQLHDTRRILKRLTSALDRLPEEMRREVTAALNEHGR
jgi:chaperone modulatory protein CbpM